jgi:hypothetical protein
MVRTHRHFLEWRVGGLTVSVSVLLAVVSTLVSFVSVSAQTPTPWPTPTPIVTGEYVVQQSVTYGEGGVMVGLLFVAGLLLLDIFLHLSERLTDR